MRVKKRVKGASRKASKASNRHRPGPTSLARACGGSAEWCSSLPPRAAESYFIRTPQPTLSPEADEQEPQESDVAEADEQEPQESRRWYKQHRESDVEKRPNRSSKSPTHEDVERGRGRRRRREAEEEPNVGHQSASSRRAATAQRSPRKGPRSPSKAPAPAKS